MSLRSSFRKHNIHRTLLNAGRTVAPMLFAFALSGVAHAQGTMDFSGAQTLMGTFKTFAIYAGAVICFGGLIFAGIRMMSSRFQDAIPGLFGCYLVQACSDGVQVGLTRLPASRCEATMHTTKRGEVLPCDQAQLFVAKTCANGGFVTIVVTGRGRSQDAVPSPTLI
jgi:hypothetical protein